MAKVITATIAAALLIIIRCDIVGAGPLRISYAAIASDSAGIWMAEGSGTSKRQGLDVQFGKNPR